MLPKVLVLLAFMVVLGVPWLFRPETATVPDGAARLVVITPHNEQIRYEFGRAFDLWHRRNFDQPAVIDWRQPGGTSEIRKLLIAQYTAAVQTGRISAEGTLRVGAEPMPYDIFLGGGTYEHTETKRGIKATPIGTTTEVSMPMSVPMTFETSVLDEWYGENSIGIGTIYDPDQYWLGTALSGFGIVFNRDVLREMNLPDPNSWLDMTNPKLAGWVALADPRQSGSVATTYESILNSYDWDEGWRILRAMCANARYFSNTSPKPPLDVSQGNAAMGTAIDFYGRYQSQALMREGETPETSRVGYVDPPGVVFIDPDPVSILRAGPNPELSVRFVEFLMSEEAQALWQFPARGRLSAPAEDGLGPERYELRRMPIRRVMYEKYAARMIDQVDPFAAASTAPNRGWRSAVGPMMGAFAIDVHEDMVHAWKAIDQARADGAPESLIAEMESLFFAFPMHTIPAKGDAPEQTLPFNKENYRAIRADWRDAEAAGRMTRIRLGYALFFRENYRRIAATLEERSLTSARP